MSSRHHPRRAKTLAVTGRRLRCRSLPCSPGRHDNRDPAAQTLPNITGRLALNARVALARCIPRHLLFKRSRGRGGCSPGQGPDTLPCQQPQEATTHQRQEHITPHGIKGHPGTPADRGGGDHGLPRWGQGPGTDGAAGVDEGPVPGIGDPHQGDTVFHAGEQQRLAQPPDEVALALASRAGAGQGRGYLGPNQQLGLRVAGHRCPDQVRGRGRLRLNP